MFRKRLVVVLFGLALGVGAATSASAQGRHLVGSAVSTVTHVVGISGDQGNVQEGDQGNVDNGAVDNADQGDKGNIDQGNQGN